MVAHTQTQRILLLQVSKWTGSLTLVFHFVILSQLTLTCVRLFHQESNMTDEDSDSNGRRKIVDGGGSLKEAQSLYKDADIAPESPNRSPFTSH